ncbi:hypothetical protein [Geopsychrobacter electrodiphilus]|uniref:hypothetical protein n=1 Tax=Geopsychrobacter electrodiphilus TaxID=225196 RepID=UPI000370A021|nr:hypothetical protein [Geopsychrobacter electrodiphilus]
MSEQLLNLQLAKYLRTRALTSPWKIEPCLRTDFTAVVVIPALAEFETLPETLAALGRNPLSALAETLIVVVVNHRASASATHKVDNRKTLAWLKTQPCPGLNLAWVDACSSGRELPDKDGVGLARKIGCDLALSHLDWTASPLVIALDADTLVDASYLPAIFAHFRRNSSAGTYLPFRHQTADTPAQEAAMRRYELYLRSYQFGLQLAGSPYAFIALGSALACRAQAYVAAGGMKRRLAGEDFYFLQQLVKTGGVSALCGTLVKPAARYSARVPFGTGQALSAEVEEGRQLYQFVSHAGFAVLNGWLSLIQSQPAAQADRLLACAEQLSPLLRQYLDETGFAAAWDRLQQNAGRGSLLTAFHHWFDGLRTRQLLMRLETASPPLPPEGLVAELLAAGGYPGLYKGVDQLQFLEQQQGVPAQEPREKTG